MHRTIIALVASLAMLASGALTTPAKANEDLAGALAAIAGIVVLGAIIKDARDDKRQKQHAHVYRPQPHQYAPRHDLTPRPLPNRVNRKLLPQQCLRTVDTERRGSLPAFGRRCLERNYRYANSLPQQCLRRVWTERGWRNVYGARCLNRQGYQLSRNY